MSFIAAIPAWVLTATTLGSAAIGAVAAVNSAAATSAAADYNARIAGRDMVVADQNRKLAVDTARIDADDKRRENRRMLASMRTAYGASGVSMAGSPLDVLQDSAGELELDAQRIEYEGQIRNRDGALQMLGLSESANLSRMESRSARSAGRIGAVGSLVSGAGKALQRTA